MEKHDIKPGMVFGFFNKKELYECIEVLSDKSVSAKKTRSDGKKYGREIKVSLSDIHFVQRELFGS